MMWSVARSSAAAWIAACLFMSNANALGPNLNLSVTAVDFGNVSAGSTSQTIQVTGNVPGVLDNGYDTLTWGFVLSGASPAAFAATKESNCIPTVTTFNFTCTVDVSFSPLAASGVTTATLRFFVTETSTVLPSVFTPRTTLKDVSLTGNAVSAPAYGTDYLAFRGQGVILDNPAPAACTQNSNFSFGSSSTFFVLYRFSANPGLVADAMEFVSSSGDVFRIVSTQSPGFSLNGTSTTSWSVFNRLGNLNSGTGTSTINIASGLNTPVGLATGVVKFGAGHISNFFGIAGCNLTNFHAAAVPVPQ